MTFPKVFIVALVAVSLAACAQTGIKKQHGGLLAGAALGGLAGSQIGGGRGKLIAVGAGVLLGALLGNEIGKSLDRMDEMHASRSYETAMESTPTGQTVAWNNPDSGHSGTYTPVKTYQSTDSGQYCREFQQTITVGGRTETAYGTACRQPDGDWKIVNS